MSIYRDRRSGRWRFDFDRYIKRPDGAVERVRRRHLLPEGWTRAQADAFDRQESAALYALAVGIVRPRHHIDAAVACYRAERLPQLKHGRTVELELEATRDWWEGRPIDELHQVAAEYAADQDGALKPATIKNRIAYLRAACRYAWKRHGLVDVDPGARVIVPTVRNERRVYIDRRQMLKLARACGFENPNQRATRAMIRVAFYTGMRFGEVARARVEGDELVLDDSKNGDERRVPIHPRIRPLVGYQWPIHETMSYWFRLAREKAGMPEVWFHSIRHSTASQIISNEGSLAEVGAVLGHRSPASSQRYAHLLPEAMRAAVARIGRKRA